MPDVSPTKWHRAHTTWFFETFLLSPRCPRYAPFDPAYAYLFNSYYEAVGPRHPRPQRGLLSRPSVAEIARYRAHVDDAMHELIDDCDAEAAALDRARPASRAAAPRAPADGHQARAALQSDRSRLRDSTVRSRGRRRRCASSTVHGGNVEIGHDGDGLLVRQREPASRRAPRTDRHRRPSRVRAEWLEFIADDGYHRPELWLSDGWYAVQENGWEAPLYWRDDGADGWSVFTLGGRRALDPNEPVVHVSHYEADAYARWRDARLPTEFEWEHAVAVLAARHVARDRRRRLAVDVERVSPLSALSARGRARSVNTTASS